MPVSPVIPNCVQVRLLWAHQNSLAINVLNAQAAGGLVVNQALANSLGSAIKAAFQTNLAAHYNAGTALSRVGVRDMRQANQAEFLDTGAISTGSAVGDSTPVQVALALTLRTAKSGKSFRGRSFLPGMTEVDNVAGGQISTAGAAAAVAFMAALQSAMTAAQLTLAVASREAEQKTLVETTFHSDGTSTLRLLSTTKAKSAQLTTVTSVESRNLFWETQRRRSNGRGAPQSFLNPPARTSF